ncbi:MAG: DNA repair protein [Myxococcota bacterium]
MSAADPLDAEPDGDSIAGDALVDHGAARPLKAPLEALARYHQLRGEQRSLSVRHTEIAARLEAVRAELAIAGEVAQTLDQMSQELFGGVVALLEEKLTIALQEVLEQAIRLDVQTRYLRGSAAIEFQIVRKGEPEHILKGQGGSVANILSVGLRMFALTALDPKVHRRFLVLDEQDCWLHPDLVPRLVRIIHEAGRALGFQIVMISHHDWRIFERYADLIYRFEPSKRGVQVVRP